MQPLPLRLLSLKEAAAQLDELGVQVANNGGSNAIAVAEHAIALLLSYYRRMPEAIEHAHSGGWSSGPPLPELPLRREINGKTIGIVGFGNVGRQVPKFLAFCPSPPHTHTGFHSPWQIARRLSGFDVELLYYDPLELSPSRDRELGATVRPLAPLPSPRLASLQLWSCDARLPPWTSYSSSPTSLPSTCLWTPPRTG